MKTNMKKTAIGIFIAITFFGNIAYAGTQYTDAQIKQAEGIMYAVKQYANIYEEGGHLVVEFRKFVHPYNINNRYQLISMIANADCVITRKARSIYFYNPGNIQMGQADTLRGIRLID